MIRGDQARCRLDLISKGPEIRNGDEDAPASTMVVITYGLSLITTPMAMYLLT
jgi:hypothetical protein